jgi:hypothetical protein
MYQHCRAALCASKDPKEIAPNASPHDFDNPHNNAKAQPQQQRGISLASSCKAFIKKSVQETSM